MEPIVHVVHFQNGIFLMESTDDKPKAEDINSDDTGEEPGFTDGSEPGTLKSDTDVLNNKNNQEQQNEDENGNGEGDGITPSAEPSPSTTSEGTTPSVTPEETETPTPSVTPEETETPTPDPTPSPEVVEEVVPVQEVAVD